MHVWSNLARMTSPNGMICMVEGLDDVSHQRSDERGRTCHPMHGGSRVSPMSPPDDALYLTNDINDLSTSLISYITWYYSMIDDIKSTKCVVNIYNHNGHKISSGLTILQTSSGPIWWHISPTSRHTSLDPATVLCVSTHSAQSQLQSTSM